MTPPHDVYLEVDKSGLCMAHVLDLPGCFVRAANEEAALTALPPAIRAYHDWLVRHGETVPEASPPGSLRLRVVAASRGFGPFRRGDIAALFEPERQPMTRQEMKRYLRLADYTRADLLALVRPLSKALREWRPHPEAMNIRQILRHIGNSEQWYVSRLVDPETLPPQWENDADMPIFKFLAMERSTVVDRLHRLTDEELANVVFPAHFTDHPDEPWTARKALRRLLEHEREHTDHIRHILAAWRQQRPATGATSGDIS